MTFVDSTKVNFRTDGINSAIITPVVRIIESFFYRNKKVPLIIQSNTWFGHFIERKEAATLNFKKQTHQKF